MNKHYIIFKRNESSDLVGFSMRGPTQSSGLIYNYLEVSKAGYLSAINLFEKGEVLSPTGIYD